MLFVGRWCKVAACARQRLQDIRPFLAETKQKLLSDMQETRDAIASENETLLQQTTALEELTAELQLAVSDKAAVAAARMDVQQRLEAAREYKELRDDLAPAEQDIENFMQKSASGNGDSGMVPPVRRLAECLSGLSKIFQQRLCADREIQEAMIKFTETVSALQNLPEQFAAVDRMLNEAETTLSAQMNVQDEHDRQIRDRQG
jgi:DNA repair exonuclease SbcCD ATPase subunit